MYKFMTLLNIKIAHSDNIIANVEISLTKVFL